MTIPFLSVKPKSIKLKVSPRFPAQLIGRTGIDVTKSNGNYYIDLAYANFPLLGSVPTGNEVLVYDPVSGNYSLVPAIQFGGGINTDSPQDGSTYGRRNGAWDKSLSLANGGTVSGSVSFTLGPTGPTAAPGTNTTQFATTAFVLANGGALPSSTTPLVDSGTGVIGTGTTYARADHQHPVDTSRLAVAGNQTITGGFNVAPNNLGSISSGTVTPSALSGNYQYLTNNGAFTLAAPAADCAMDILVTNGATAGGITFSGYTVGANTGDLLTTTNTNKFIISIRRINSISTYTIKALQ